jgi:hypothetical protein
LELKLFSFDDSIIFPKNENENLTNENNSNNLNQKLEKSK